MAVQPAARDLSNAYHAGTLVWVGEKAVTEGPAHLKKAARWVKGRVESVSKSGADGVTLIVKTEEGATRQLTPAECPLQNPRDDTVDDLVKSDFLHEPGCVTCCLMSRVQTAMRLIKCNISADSVQLLRPQLVQSANISLVKAW